jgi:hypothetical protein
MAKTYIAEYADMRAGQLFGLIVEQTALTNSGTTQPSAAFNDDTKFIRVHSDGIISYKVSRDPVVTIANSMRLPAGGTFDLAVQPGDKIAIIINT